MTQRAYADYMHGTPTEMIIFSGKTDSGRDIEMCVSKAFVLQIVEGMKITNHVGHAIWHAQHPEATFPCSSCESVIEEEKRAKERDEWHRKLREETEA